MENPIPWTEGHGVTRIRHDLVAKPNHHQKSHTLFLCNVAASGDGPARVVRLSELTTVHPRPQDRRLRTERRHSAHPTLTAAPGPAWAASEASPEDAGQATVPGAGYPCPHPSPRHSGRPDLLHRLRGISALWKGPTAAQLSAGHVLSGAKRLAAGSWELYRWCPLFLGGGLQGHVIRRSFPTHHHGGGPMPPQP